MSRDIYPEFSKGAVNRAGEVLRIGNSTGEDERIVENWRASHNHILNTFQENLRRKAKDFGIRTPVQRIKRLETIKNKLNRFSHMQLARMHDIVGCRVVFDDLDTLNEFRNEFNRSRFRHKRRTKLNSTGTKVDAYNYIENPKDTGYRGIHDVFTYRAKPTGKSDSATNTRWDGLNIEIQYRTNIQHAWATAVEICDVYKDHHGKFGQAPTEYLEYFQVASELLARKFENKTGCLPDINDQDLRLRFLTLEKAHKMLSTLERIQPHESKFDASKNTLLLFDEQNERTHVRVFDDFRQAVGEYFKAEKETDYLAVLVAADDPESVRFGFKNYFSDAREFVSLMHGIIEGR